jgi:hypothetical protein
MWRSGSGTRRQLVHFDANFAANQLEAQYGVGVFLSAVYGPSQQGRRLEGQANLLIVGL